MDLLAVHSGFGVGAIAGMTGVGGASLMTLLVLLLMSAFGLAPAVAIGADLWCAAITKSGGSWVHHKPGPVDCRSFWPALGLRLERWLPEQRRAVLTLASGALLGAGIKVLA